MRGQFISIVVLLASSCCGCGSHNSTDIVPPTLADMPKLHGPVSFDLEDGELRQHEAPDTFQMPSREQRESLIPGDSAKLMFRFSDWTNSLIERMWVIVKAHDDEGYIGTLNNTPYCTDHIQPGMEVRFLPKHVVSVRAPEMQSLIEVKESN